MNVKVPEFFKRHKRLSLIGSLAVVIAIGGAAYLLLKSDSSVLSPMEPERYYSQLTGEEVSEEASDRPVLGVMIENSEFARPQTGLDSAGIVFETTTEAGITRYLALFQGELPSDVGPVRSVRPAFVDWLMGFDAYVAHVGGSAAALEMIDQRSAKSLNQFFNEEPYYRSDEREAPHNMYASLQKLYDLIAEKGNEKSDFMDIPRDDTPAPAEPAATTVSIDFSTPEFSTQYRYNAETNTYTRYLAGQPHIDAATGKPITVSNVVVLKMGQNIDALGEGQAIVFRDGQVFTGRWEQDSYDARVRLYQTAEGQQQEIALNVGDSWFAAVPATGSVTH